MANLTLEQRNGATFSWQVQNDPNAHIDTGAMSDCVSAIYIDGLNFRGYHGGGGLGNVNFAELKKSCRDGPFSKLIIVMGSHYADADLTIRDALCAIRYHGFQFVQWEFYKANGGAIVSRQGTVTDKDNNLQLPRLRAFISKFAPGLNEISYEEAMPYDEKRQLEALKKRPLPPIPGKKIPPPPPHR
jgi:hypothetical protein